VHLGHEKVLSTLKDYARSHSLRPLVITFDRHPLEVVAPERVPRMLQSRRDRDGRLLASGVDVEEVAFTPELCSLTAKEWMKILRDRYGAKAIITGYDNTFGSDGRRLAAEDYRRLGAELGLEVIEAPELPGVCSSCIRRAVAEGEVMKASAMLGRDYTVRGRVVKGRQLGRQIGFPTANLEIDKGICLPASGVYAAQLNGLPAVANIGDNPTVEEGNPITVEAHIIGFDGDIYGQEAALSFVERLRGEIKFDSLEELKKQIGLDAEKAEKLLFNRY
ncbi:MAG: riboflavin biosynthesis protein RibF, partial [Muribaculaceae bacterium]|nr:riboflavin biosynthesis protein RibF [Muribaculaceae bacterium]